MRIAWLDRTGPDVYFLYLLTHTINLGNTFINSPIWLNWEMKWVCLVCMFDNINI